MFTLVAFAVVAVCGFAAGTAVGAHNAAKVESALAAAEAELAVLRAKS